MSNLKKKIDHALECRGETMVSLHRRLNEEGFQCSLMTLYNWVNGVVKKVPNGAFQAVAKILEVDYDDLMDPATDSIEVHTQPTLLFVDQQALARVLLKVIACPEASPEDKETAARHITAWLDPKNAKNSKSP